MEELSLATKNFSDKNLIGEGKFGEVYMGFLHDGMLVAIKKRPGLPSQEFTNEVIGTFFLQVFSLELVDSLQHYEYVLESDREFYTVSASYVFEGMTMNTSHNQCLQLVWNFLGVLCHLNAE